MMSLVGLLKMLPVLESIISTIWKGYEKYRIQHDMETAANIVSNATKTESTKDINEELGKK